MPRIKERMIQTSLAIPTSLRDVLNVLKAEEGVNVSRILRNKLVEHLRSTYPEYVSEQLVEEVKAIR